MKVFSLWRRPLVAVWWSLKWSALAAAAGALSGAASAMLLESLGWATATREATPGLLWLLPLAGAVIGGCYHRFGKSADRGMDVLLDRVHGAGREVPLRMAPLIGLATVTTHLFGGSAGREGAAVELGGSLTGLVGRPLRLSREDRRMLLVSGISGGFSSIFSTPLAGMIFGLEVPTGAGTRHRALLPCLVSALVADVVCRGLGAHQQLYSHHLFTLSEPLTTTPALWAWIVLAGLAFGAAGFAFAWLLHAIRDFSKARIAQGWARTFLGGIVVILMTMLVGSRDYLGLSLPLILRSFSPEGVPLGAFALKLVFTAVTLGTGFRGGDISPMFCIGAGLGWTFATLTGQSPAFFAALGFVAVFAAAAKTPLTCIVMGVELFGANMAGPLALTCVVSRLASGRRGLYLSQRDDAFGPVEIHAVEGAGLADGRGGLTVEISGLSANRPRSPVD